MPLRFPPKASDPRDRVEVRNYVDKLDLVDDERGQYSREKAYGQTRWKAISAVQLSKKPLCERCSSFGEVSIAEHADHIIPHRGDQELFWKGKLQSLCVSCHSWKTNQEPKGKFFDYSDGSEQVILES